MLDDYILAQPFVGKLSYLLGATPEIEIRRAANPMLKRYGDNAEAESARRAHELAVDGDDAGVAVWRRAIDVIGLRRALPRKIPARGGNDEPNRPTRPY
jgi:hypothetical protein